MADKDKVHFLIFMCPKCFKVKRRRELGDRVVQDVCTLHEYPWPHMSLVGTALVEEPPKPDPVDTSDILKKGRPMKN